MAFGLIGFMGAGKSNAARELAAALAAECYDSDAVLQERFGHSVAEEFARGGEAAFRAAEERVVCELLASAGSDAVIALGGGSVLSEQVRAALAAHVTVLLDVPVERCWERVGSASEDGEPRPLAHDREAFARLYAERAELYERLADAVIVQPPRGAVARAAGALRALARTRGARLLWASASAGQYPVFIAPALLSDPASLERVWPLAKGSRRFLVSDTNVAPLYAPRLGGCAAAVTIAAGEEHKTVASAQRIWGELLAARMTRADHVVGLGGGVVGDLAGFCAGTYQRGVPVVHVPTTLVAQVDSAYGGKTGVDLPEAKNYVGIYHQPAGVIVDPEALATLPAAELAAGWVEVLKTALIAGGSLWHAVAAGAEVDERMILACVRTKLTVVSADERDAGVRQVLNLGHTVGHAIEASAGYGTYRHGEAVGLGLLATLRLSGQEELREHVRTLLVEHGLPVTLAHAAPERVLETIAHDKKRMGAEVPFVLMSAPGEVSHGCAVAQGELRAAVRELSA